MNFKKISAVIISTMLVFSAFTGCKESDSKNDTEAFVRSLLVDNVNGKTTVSDESTEKDVVMGMNLVSGNNVTVDKLSDMTMIMDMNKHFYAGEKTKFSLTADGKENSTKTYINLAEGSVLVAIDEELKPKEEFVVNVPNAAMSVRGTVFLVEVKKQGEMYLSKLDVFKGEVEVTLTSGKKESVPAGKSVTVVSESDEKFGFLVDKEGVALKDSDLSETSIIIRNKVEDFIKSSGDDQVVPEPVQINEVNFPSEKFRNYIDQFDTDGDTILSGEELMDVRLINISGRYKDLTGIEYFTNLETLFCDECQLTSLDLSKNTQLEYIYCCNNELTELKLGDNSRLTNLDCGNNKLQTLDVTRNIALTDLTCRENEIKTLDLTKNTVLSKLHCVGNMLTTIDLSNNTLLQELSIGHNQIKELDLSKNIELKNLTCVNMLLNTIDLSNNILLEELWLDKNPISSFSPSNNKALKELFIGDCQLISLDISNNTELVSLSCASNKLTSLDLSNNTKLKKIQCSHNQLTELDLSKNTKLDSLACHYNKLKSIDIRNNPYLKNPMVMDNHDPRCPKVEIIR